MNDKRWIRAIRRGNTEAFEGLYDAYRQPVFRYACSVTGGRAEAEDLLQEAFLGLLRNVDRVDERRPLLPYLFQSVRNRHVDRLRSFENRRQPLPSDPPSRRSGVSEQVEEEERARVVAEAIARLPEAQAEVVRLRIYGGLTYDAIGEHLSVPAATIRNRYRAALDQLRPLLGRSLTDV